MSHKFTKLGNVLDGDNYEWLLSENPVVAEVIETEVLAGATPEDIRRYMLAQIGDHRTAYINRCVSAARWLEGRRD